MLTVQPQAKWHRENMSKITFFEGKKNIQTLSCQGNNTKPTSELV